MSPMGDTKKTMRRDRLFTAAYELFEEKGFAATTMKEIAERADMAVGTLYNYYGSKNALLLGIMEKRVTEAASGFRREIISILRKERDAFLIIDTIFALLLREFLVFSKRTWVEIFSALFSVGVDWEKGMRLDFQAISMFSDVVQIMQKRGLISNEFDPYDITYTLYSTMLIQLMTYIFLPEFSEEQLRQGLSKQLRIVFVGIRPGTGVTTGKETDGINDGEGEA